MTDLNHQFKVQDWGYKPLSAAKEVAWRNYVYQQIPEKDWESKSGPELAKNINTVFCRDVAKNFFSFFFKISHKISMIQEQDNWVFGNTEIANNQQLLSSDDLYNFVINL